MTDSNVAPVAIPRKSRTRGPTMYHVRTLPELEFLSPQLGALVQEIDALMIGIEFDRTAVFASWKTKVASKNPEKVFSSLIYALTSTGFIKSVGYTPVKKAVSAEKKVEQTSSFLSSASPTDKAAIFAKLGLTLTSEQKALLGL